MKDFKFSYARKMKKKIFIDANKKNIQVVVELNIIDNIYKINWINDTSSGHDNFKDSLGVAEDKELIELSLEYAKTLKQYNEIVSRYDN